MQIWSIEPQQCSAADTNTRHLSRTPSPRSKPASPSETREVWKRKAGSGDVPVMMPERLLAAPTSLRTTLDALRTVEDVEQFTVIHMPFMLGNSFTLDFRRAAYAALRLSAPIMTEGYLAFLGLMTRYQKSLVLRRGEPDLYKAAKGLQRLQNVNIMHEYDAACVLFLGQAMYVFNVLTAATSTTAHSIVRSSLITTKQWYPRLIRFPAMDTVIVTPILIDTVECLVRREVPIVRLVIPGRVVVDRYVGLCSTLLPHLYDLCERSNALKKAGFDTTSEPRPGVHDSFADIEQAIREWKPETPARLFTEYGKHEILIMVAQAKVYCLAALLIIHRLRCPFGVEDGPATDLANSIISELSYFARAAAKDATALPVVFPLIVAMLEIEGPGEEILEKLSSYTVQSICAAKLQGFVKQVRASRESGFRGVWFDLVDTQLHAAVVP
ncbi:hypothetical protein N7474_000572 [Penicillium riverlandense]|uniref:uncharacterized protein n=1 Tax=Penicillium riverlandense TaxID=1903569 RepID=UPI0025482D74|nr:uncharacterized protein N7474_000572 [Penicillium riverlandense]KAJ5832261.1 hypothetical protein N7474_000572 [Penicillium riverlandense]